MTGAPIRVVVADDDVAFLETLRELIGRQPELQVAGAATNGLEAVELVQALDPEAVVVDLRMPLLDGVGTVERLRRSHPTLCLIALTGDPDPALHRAARAAGADAVLEKHELTRGLVERLSALRRAASSAA
jgi:DNA-binding NarL/FixJ family response regulator